MSTTTKRQLFPYALVILLGYIGFSLPLPILPEMFLDPEISILGSMAIETKTILLGVAMACYPLGQLIGGPILGFLSDAYGRKKMILLSLFCTAFGYAITAVSVSEGILYGIFGGLFISGLSEGNIAIAQSVVADLSPDHDKKTKAMHFGWINLFVTTGFIIGPLIGGQLADTSLVSWFSFATPFWGGMILTLIAIVVIAKFSQETRAKPQVLVESMFSSIAKSFLHPRLRMLFLANFFLALGFFSFFRFFPVYLERLFDLTAPQLAFVIAYNSVAFAIALIFLIKPLAHYFSSIRITQVCSILLGLLFFVSLIPDNPWFTLITVPPIGIVLAIVITFSSVTISNSADHERHGQVMGNLQSTQVFAEVVTGLAGGWLAARSPSLPLVIGALMSFCCTFLLFFHSDRGQHV